MTEKIAWYKEVLELEPNSKVFFPLARLLTDAHCQDEAIAVLEQGLVRHEDFLEARLFLIELLHNAGSRAACEKQVTKLTGMLSSYAGFWQAWAACLAAAGDAPDIAAMLRFLALNFSSGSVSLHEVINHGLNSLADERERLVAGAMDQLVDASIGAKPPTEVSGKASSEEGSSAAVMEVEHDENTEGTESGLSLTFDPNAAMADGGSGADIQPSSADLAADDAEEEGEEHFSLRTRSMAEVLAEQGDIKGALDIYHELEAISVHPEESADLRQRIATLNARLGSVQSIDATLSPDGLEPASGKDKLISMLEALAERVEARAHS